MIDVGTAVVLVGLIFSAVTLVLKYIPSRRDKEPQTPTTYRADIHDRLLLLEHDHKNLSNVVSELKGVFTTTSKDLSDKLQEIRDIVSELRAQK